MSTESNPMSILLVRYSKKHGTYELGKYVSGPGSELLREVLADLNKLVRLEVKESA